MTHHSDQTAGAVPGARYRAIDTTRPHPARRYDYWLGGKDNFAADRESADQIIQVFPHIRTAVLENRRFLRRSVAFLTREAGIRQFLDIGTGIPTSPNVHEVAQLIAPDSRVVYVDNDPVVVAHARARMVSSRPGVTSYVRADVRDPEAILADPGLRDTLDLRRPVGLLLVAVLHFLGDEDEPYRAVARLLAALPPGSFLVLSHATLDPLPADVVRGLTDLVTPGGEHGTFQARNRAEVARFFDGLTMLDPGLVPIVDWRPDLHPKPQASEDQTGMYGGVAVLDQPHRPPS